MHEEASYLFIIHAIYTASFPFSYVFVRLIENAMLHVLDGYI